MSSSSANTSAAPGGHRRLAVPDRDGDVLVEPPVAEFASLLSTNQNRFQAAAGIDIQGRSLADLRNQARSEMLAQAFRYTSEIGGTGPAPTPSGPIILSGHQPELFHPGVWAKNVAAAAIARSHAGAAVNLIIDADICQHASIRLPVDDSGAVRAESADLDRTQPAMPWEDRRVVDASRLERVRAEATRAMSAWNITPLLSEIPLAAEPGERLSDVLTRARRTAEQMRGLQNLELPLSRLAGCEAFRRFACYLLANAPRFAEVHNRALDAFRRKHKVRSRSHPVPPLGTKDGWVEVPLWTWTEGEHERRRLYARQVTTDALEISDGTQKVAVLPLGPGMDACCAAEELAGLESTGRRIRPRALTTTMFARVFLGDAFIHGVGGAKYDEMTDHLIRDFIGLDAPEFITVTATLQLLKDHIHEVGPDERSRLERQLREIKHSPEQYLADRKEPEIRQLVQEKQQLLAAQRDQATGDASANRERYVRFREINQQLQAFTDPQRAAIRADIERIERTEQRNAQLRGRDWPFVLYPADRLWAMCDRIDP